MVIKHLLHVMILQVVVPGHFTSPTHHRQGHLSITKIPRQINLPTSRLGVLAWFFGPYCWWLKSCTTWDVWSPINHGINYQPQLVSRISAINSMWPISRCLLSKKSPRWVGLPGFSGFHLPPMFRDGHLTIACRPMKAATILMSRRSCTWIHLHRNQKM